MSRVPSTTVFVVLFAGAAACDSSGDVRQWTPADHDQPTTSPAAQGQVTARPAGQAPAPSDDPGLIDLAWQRNCTQCHGRRGAGDGPQGPMIKAPDLTRAEWQDKATDEEMALTIRKGKNKMPAFDLPAQIIEGLVKRIRANRVR